MAVALSGAMIPQPVQADGANSISNVYRARNRYEHKLYKLSVYKSLKYYNFTHIASHLSYK